MNEALTEILKAYSTMPHKRYAEKLHGYSKDTLVALFSDLLTKYINDKNSSTLREFLTVSLAGYRHSENKIGFNGFKQTTSGKSIACEAKPKNINYQDYEDYQAKKRKSYPKLSGNGNFTDYTWARFNKDKRENLNMLVSGFIDGKLIYLLEFPFATETFINNIKSQLERHFPNDDITGRYLRSATFNYRHFYKSKDIKVIYCAKDIKTDDKCQKLIVGNFYQWLLNFGSNNE